MHNGKRYFTVSTFCLWHTRCLGFYKWVSLKRLQTTGDESNIPYLLGHFRPKKRAYLSVGSPSTETPTELRSHDLRYPVEIEVSLFYRRSKVPKCRVCHYRSPSYFFNKEGHQNRNQILWEGVDWRTRD